jgi:cytochrome P450
LGEPTVEIFSINKDIDVGRLDHSKFVDLDLGGDEMRNRAYRGLLAEWGSNPPFYVVNQGIPYIVIGRYNEVKEVYLDRDRFSVVPPNLPGYERLDSFNGIANIGQTDSAVHDRARMALMPAFGPASLVHFENTVRRIVDEMLDEMEALVSFDFINDFASKLLVRILFDGLLGMSQSQQEAFVRINDAFPLVINTPPGEPRPKEFLDALDGVLVAIGEMVAERRASPRKHDFVSTLVEVHDTTGKISADEVVGNIFALLGGGQGTTTVSATAMIMNLCKHRDQFDEVINNPDLIAQTVEESLRMGTPGYVSAARYARCDCDIGGVQILKGMPVMISPQAANFDPDQYPDPLNFDIHRKPKNIMSFGAGMHHCIGNRLARLVLGVVLEKICRRFPGIQLQEPDFVPHYVGMFAELRPASLPVRLF